MDLEELQRKIDYLADMEAIKQLQGRYQYWLCKMDYEKIAERCFVRETPGSMMEASDSGVFREVEGIDRFFDEHMAMLRHKKGFFTLHTAVAPVIEIARDRQTAKGIWFEIGCFGAQGAEDAWAWGFYLIDYAREHEEWKLWHVNFTPFFRTPYKRGWSEVPVSESVSDGLQDGPPTAWNPYDPSKTGPEELFWHLPDVPEPYETW